MHDDELADDPRVAAVSNNLFHAFKSDYASVEEAAEATTAMAIIAVRTLDQLAAAE